MKAYKETIRKYYKYASPAPGYRELSYLYAQAGSYIDTNFIPNSNSKIDCAMAWTTSATGNIAFGAGVGYQDRNIELYSSGASFEVHYSAYTVIGSYNPNKYFRFVQDKGNIVIYNEDGSQNSTYNFGTKTFDCVYTMTLFATHRSTINTSAYPQYLQYFKIYDNEVLVRDFVPAERVSDNVIGLYDKVNSVFYTNLGSNTFTKGEYIIEESTSSDYDFYEDEYKYKLVKETIRKYYKYVTWTQPVLTSNNSSDIMWVSASNEGQGAAFNAFDDNVSSTNWCTSNNITTAYLYVNINENIYISSISVTGYTNVYGHTDTITIYSNDIEIGATKTYNYSQSNIQTWTFNSPVKVSSLTFKGTGLTWTCIPNITITAQKVINGTSSDYDFYEDEYKYKLVKDTIRTYYKRASFTSDSTFTVPFGITKLKIDCVGAKGKDDSAVGGNGGRVQCDLAVSAGDVLNITVGAIPTGATRTPMYNASDVRTGGTAISNRIIIAGGGGNGGHDGGRGATQGGAGGGTTGGDGVVWRNVDPICGYGGTQSAGGRGGYTTSTYYYSTGANGELANGGQGGAIGNEIGGAGGAGYYGGGGGGCYEYSGGAGGGGGGGSSYADSSLCSNVVHTQGYNDGAGYVYIDYPSTSSDYDYYVDENTYKAFNI